MNHIRAATDPVPSSYTTTCVPEPAPMRPSTRAKSSSGGNGWRPGPPCRERSRSMSTYTAPGMCPARYFSRAGGPDSDQRRSTMRTDPSACRASQSTSTRGCMSDMHLPPAPYRVLTPTPPNGRCKMDSGRACKKSREAGRPGGTVAGRGVCMRSEGERLLVVDDEGPILHALQRTFEAAGYDVTACLDPAEALDRLREREYQVLSADYMMPGMTGAEFLARARALQPETIRILITAAHDFSAAVDAINNGEIFRILAKPWNRVELLGTVRQAFDTYALREKNRQLTALVQRQNGELADLNRGLERLVEERTTNLLDGMVAVLDYRDTETQWHSRRVSRFTRRIAEQLGIRDGHELRTIEMGALLHDIGKIGVRDAVLLKPGPLDQEEWHEMREHPRLGWALLQRI